MIKTEGVPFWPDAAWRDVVFAFLLIFTIFLMAWYIGPPPLKTVPNPNIIDASPQPYWYFLWFFSVLAMSPHAGETFLIIATPSVFFIVMFLLPFIANKGERSPKRRPWAIALVIMSVIIIGVFWRKAELHPWVPDFTAHICPLQLLPAPIHLSCAELCYFTSEVVNTATTSPDMEAIVART